MKTYNPEILLNSPVPHIAGTLKKVMGNKWWDVTRKAAYTLHDDHCHACGKHKLQGFYRRRLEAHEFTTQVNGEITLERVVALCYACHNFIHCDYVGKQVASGEVSVKHGREVMRLGLQLLKENGSSQPPRQSLLYMVYENYTKAQMMEIFKSKGIVLNGTNEVLHSTFVWVVDGVRYKSVVPERTGTQEKYYG